MKRLIKTSKHGFHNRTKALLYIDGEIMSGENHPKLIENYLNWYFEKKEQFIRDWYKKNPNKRYTEEYIQDKINNYMDKLPPEIKQGIGEFGRMNFNLDDNLPMAFAHQDEKEIFIEEDSLRGVDINTAAQAFKNKYPNCDVFNDDQVDSDGKYIKLAKLNRRIMSTMINLAKFTIREECCAAHNGQKDMVMYAYQDGEFAGTLEYAIYQDEPHIVMIEVEPKFRRQGVAKALMQDLQGKFPDTEIIWGYTTEEGNKLKQAITIDKEDSEIIEKQKEFDSITKEIEKLESENNPANFDKLGDLYDRQTELERELEGTKPYKNFVISKKLIKKPDEPKSPQVLLTTPLYPTDYFGIRQKMADERKDKEKIKK